MYLIDFVGMESSLRFVFQKKFSWQKKSGEIYGYKLLFDGAELVLFPTQRGTLRHNSGELAVPRGRQ